MDPVKVSILGAGVIGLTVAYRLTEERSRYYDVTIVAEHMPGDEAAYYTSPWAGANYLPMSSEGSATQKWERDTGPFLWRLADDVPAAGVNSTPVTLLNRHGDYEEADWAAALHSSEPWFSNSVRDFRTLAPDELPPGYDTGNRFTSLCIDVPVYLLWLRRQLEDGGVHFCHKRVSHIKEAGQAHQSGNAHAIINCTGFEAATLDGVNDGTIYPVRGQLVLVRNCAEGLLTTSGTDDEVGDIMYVQPRVGGMTVLGGTYQKHSWSTEVDFAQAERIMKRCVALCPELTNGQGIEALDIIRHTVGLRPVREEGPRLEAECMDGATVIHCYGHGGYGYQSSYGSAIEVEKILQEMLGQDGLQMSAENE